MKFIIVFIVLSLINVIFSTIRSIVTIKGGKWIASLMSAGYFAFYNIMLIYTVADFPMWQKCLITFVCNFIGVYFVKVLEDKMRKDVLWKIEITFLQKDCAKIDEFLNFVDIPHSFIQNVGKHCIFNIYCQSQKESAIVKNLLKDYNGKYFASETKIL